jgi:hypothetical protein
MSITDGLMVHLECLQLLGGHRGYNDQGKQVELDCNKGCLEKSETAFDGKMEATADIMEYAIDNQVPGDLTIHSDA